MTIKPIPTGLLAGFLAYHETLTDHSDPVAITDGILDQPAAQERIVVLTQRGMSDHDILQTMNMLHKHKCRVVFQPESERPTALWYVADHIKMFTTLRKYKGTPAHEIHLYWEPAYGNEYPVVAPLGAAATNLFVYTTADNMAALRQWVQYSPTPMRIIQGVM